MSMMSEYWYVRLPDGRTVRARNADVLRGYLRAGRIPTQSRVRRSAVDEWQPLTRVAEFAESVTAESVGQGTQRTEAAPGVRGIVHELLVAGDLSLTRTKLAIGAFTGVALALGTLAFDALAEVPAGPWTPFAYGGVAALMLAALALATVLLTQRTLVELDRHRRAYAGDLGGSVGLQWLRVFATQGLVAGVLISVLLLFRTVVPWLGSHDLGDLNPLRDVLTGSAAVLRLASEIVCWPTLALALLLLGPMQAIEEFSLGRGVRAWLGIVLGQLGRLYLYETIALVLAALLAAPLLLLVGVAAYGGWELPAERVMLQLLTGLALAPALGYLLVANVFIYLNLRYDFYFSTRGR